MRQPEPAWFDVVALRGPMVPVDGEHLVMPAVVEVLVTLEGEPEGSAVPSGWHPGPHALVRIEVDADGRPGVRGIIVTDTHPAGQHERIGEPTKPITDAALRTLSIDACIRAAVEVTARSPQSGWEGRSPEAVEATVTRARRRRTETTPVRLQAVAFAYRQGRAEGGDHAAGVRAVKEHMNVGRQQSYRLVAKAQQAGLISPNPQENQP